MLSDDLRVQVAELARLENDARNLSNDIYSVLNTLANMSHRANYEGVNIDLSEIQYARYDADLMYNWLTAATHKLAEVARMARNAEMED